MSIIFPGQPASYYSFGNGILGLNGFSIQAQPPVPATTAYELTLENDGHGTVSASTLSGFPGDSATLSTTPSTDYEFSGYDVTGGTIEGNTFIYGNTDATARACFREAYKTLTLQTDGHGTLTATSITGRPGDTVTLTPTYNTYYRFSGYDCTGGTINGNTFTFGSEDATAKASFSGNAFKASGTFEALKQNYYVKDNGYGTEKTGNIPQMYAITSYHTSNVPAAWYNTSNRWKPTNPSNYSITLNPILKYNVSTGAYAGTVTAGVIGRVMVGSTANQQATVTRNSPGAGSYNKTVTTTAYNVNYGLSGRQTAKGRGGGQYTTCTCYVYMSATSGTQNGTWTATGYAP